MLRSDVEPVLWVKGRDPRRALGVGDRLDIGQTGEVVGGSGQFEAEPIASPTEAALLTPAADRPHLAQHHFDLLSAALAATLAGMPRCVTVDRAAPAMCILGHVRRYSQAGQVPDQVLACRRPGSGRARPAGDAAFEDRHGQAGGT